MSEASLETVRSRTLAGARHLQSQVCRGGGGLWFSNVLAKRGASRLKSNVVGRKKELSLPNWRGRHGPGLSAARVDLLRFDSAAGPRAGSEDFVDAASVQVHHLEAPPVRFDALSGTR